ncbi:sulfotransferase family protein [Salinisphaera sp. Q1T1-3]|uniref:sulfotransferase family protein n=1 Tax=Salinisphaera sp. Q1T1-3 TaxID=2321229 RepID=UPI000E764FB4|nr:hypothetical protein [Salinisphaera sp. Q1T1-3]RJS92207.1 hypothetical protein D3260_12510 [Salinisphaera sp. Q1T1-3]
MSEADAAAVVPPPDPERSTVVAVLGAGRSGTSAITRGLSALGVDLGANLRRAGGKNPTGFFEDNDVLAISKRLKSALGIRGHSVRLLDDAEFETPRMKAIQADAVATLGARFGNTPLWGYKYSRTLRTMPFWEGIHAALGLDTRYLIALRNPMSVARSRGKINPQRGRQVWSDMEWLVNVVPYFARTAGRPRAVVDFDRLMADPRGQLMRVARDLGLPVGPDQAAGIEEYATKFLQQDKPASRFSREDLLADPAVNRWTAEGYQLLDAVAADELSQASDEFGRRWQALARDVEALGPFLAEFDHRRAETERVRWNPASPIQALRQVIRDLEAK